MKTIYLILSIILYILIIKLQLSNKTYINEFIYSYTPRKYPARFSKLNFDDSIMLIKSNHQYSPRIFEIDDTNELKNFGLDCNPSSFGFSKEEADKLFPEEKYPDCSEVTGVNKSSLYIERDKDRIHMKCENNSGTLLYGPYSGMSLPKFVDTVISEINDTESIHHPYVEFGLGECKGDKTRFMHAVLEPLFRNEAYENAKNKIKNQERPIIIYFLTIDSFTRRHFFRKRPKTVEFFNNLKATHPDIAIYDFKLHSVYGLNSVENQVPILGLRKNFVYNFKKGQSIDKLGKDALWNMLREKGYISLMGIDGCGDAYPSSIGKNPNVDYSIRQFYCYVQNKTSINPDKNFNEQRCIGPHMNHYYLLNYTHSVSRLNQGVNQ